MKRGISIGTVVIIGLVIWWLTQRPKSIQTTKITPMRFYPQGSEYEKLHKVVPITRYVERQIPVYGLQGWEWELRAEIDSGRIPAPPELTMIPESAWYWTGVIWEARTRPGFEPIKLSQPFRSIEDWEANHA